MKLKWGAARMEKYLQTEHGKAFTKCGGVVSGKGTQMAICVRKVKDLSRELRELGYSNPKINEIIEKRVLDEFVVKRRDLMLQRADKMQKQAEQLRRIAFTTRARRSKPRSASIRSSTRHKLRFGFSVK